MAIFNSFLYVYQAGYRISITSQFGMCARVKSSRISLWSSIHHPKMEILTMVIQIPLNGGMTISKRINMCIYIGTDQKCRKVIHHSFSRLCFEVFVGVAVSLGLYIYIYT